MVENKNVTNYRRMIYLPRQLAEGDIVCSNFKADDGSALFLITDSNDMPLVISFKNNKLLTSVRRADTWLPSVEHPLPDTLADCTNFYLKAVFGHGEVVLYIDGQRLCTISLSDIDLNGIAYIDGSGELTGFYVGNPAGLGVSPRFLRDLTAETRFVESATPLIFDIGSHDGVDTAYYLAKGFRVLAVDANPVLCSRLAIAFNKDVEEKRLIILNVGIADKPGELKFYINTRFSVWGSFNRELGNRQCEAEEVIVKTTTLEELVRTFGLPYYIKIDIEGFDEIAIASLCDSAFRPRLVSFEGGSGALVEKLVQSGYDQFKLVDQTKVPAMQIPTPSREGASITHRFNHGSSGPFGDDIPGGWLTPSEIRVAIHDHFHDAVVATPGWVDIHARYRGS